MPTSGMIEGPFGVMLPDELCKAVEEMLKDTRAEEFGGFRKAFVAKAAGEFVEGERADISTVTDSGSDHDKEIVKAGGIDLSVFRKNPVVLLGHNHDELPIGKAQWIKRQGDEIKAKTVYAKRPADYDGEWKADAVWALVKAGILQGKSIGFIPMEGRETSKAEKDATGANFVFTKSVLIEYSVVAVPANSRSLVEATSKGLIVKGDLDLLGIDMPEEPVLFQGKTVGILDADDYRRQLSKQCEAAVASIPVAKMVRDAIDVAMGRV